MTIDVMNSFQKIFQGLKILESYTPACLTINPIQSSFPNGSPNHSYRAYINVEVGMKGWDMSEGERKELISLGWKPEDEDQYWIYIG